MIDQPNEKKSKEASYDIFISHASNDKDFVHRIVDELKNRGVSIWFDKSDIKPGEKWKDLIVEAIQQSRFCIVILSSNFSSADPLVSSECTAIQQYLWKKPDMPLCSLRLDNTEPPPFLRRWHSLQCKRDKSSINQIADTILIFLNDASQLTQKGESTPEGKEWFQELVCRFRELKKSLKDRDANEKEPSEND